MTLLKCKMCGGALELKPGETVAECPYCGTKQTVPNLDDDKKAQLFERANRLRAACMFDRALAAYESIITAFPEEPEAYWGELLCKYGIEYVDDPATGKKIPTCHRSSYDSIIDDEAYEFVMEYANQNAKEVYRAEAKQIESIRRGINEISSKEEPYDVFICYKETDENGERTEDSVLAQDIYNALTREGYRVFFARITLEDKLGKEYEPYIFAALNTAKVMLVVGTESDRLNAVWVKNEWSRYLMLMTSDPDKTLIPCYKGITAYDLPKEFQRLQSQDLAKIGAVQDLVRGIGKLVRPSIHSEKTTNQSKSGLTKDDIETLMKRAFLVLEDGDWNKANEIVEQVLNADPENARAYLAKLLSEIKVRKIDDLSTSPVSFANNNNYQKAIRFGEDELSSALIAMEQKNEEYRKKTIYQEANRIIESAQTEADYKKAHEMLTSISDYENAGVLAERCLAKAEEAKIVASRAMKRKRNRLIIISAVSIVLVLVISFFAYGTINAKQQITEAVTLIENGDYTGAAEYLNNMDDNYFVLSERLNKAKSLAANNEYAKACILLEGFNYKNSESLRQEYREASKEIMAEECVTAANARRFSFFRDNLKNLYKMSENEITSIIYGTWNQYISSDVYTKHHYSYTKNGNIEDPEHPSMTGAGGRFEIEGDSLILNKQSEFNVYDISGGNLLLVKKDDKSGLMILLLAE